MNLRVSMYVFNRPYIKHTLFPRSVSYNKLLHDFPRSDWSQPRRTIGRYDPIRRGYTTNQPIAAREMNGEGYRARQLYDNTSMLFLFPVKNGKLSTGVIAIFNALCYG